jgi:hypothetical protein
LESGHSTVLYHNTSSIPSPEFVLIFIKKETVYRIFMFSNFHWRFIAGDVLCYDLIFTIIIKSNEDLLIVQDSETVFFVTPILSF